MSLSTAMPFFEEKPQEPASVDVIWRDTVLAQPNQTPMRGFSGELIFYGGKEKKGARPILVEGTLVVYAFDESVGGQEKVKPDRKFVFTPEQFATHHAKSGLGHEYSVWLPWDAAGGPRKEISLIARFVPKTGKVVVGEQSRHLLPGENVVANSADGSQTQPGFAEAGVNSVRLTSYQTPVLPEGEDTRPSKMITTTIPTPLGFERHLPTGGDPAWANRLAPSTPANPRFAPAAAPKGMQASAASRQESPPAQQVGPASPSTSSLFQPRSTGFLPPRQRDLGGDMPPLTRDRAPMRPRPAEPQPPRELAPSAGIERQPASSLPIAPPA
ncbi:MAG: hypothetical protein ACLQNE_13165 [Thermoguttaceae bacterium]